MSIQAPSRGRKQCGSCKLFVGVRTRICECGFNFTMGAVAAAKKKTKAPHSSGKTRSFDMGTILTPAGKCPVELKGPTYNDVHVWISLLKAKIPNLAISAYCYYVRYFYDVNTKTHNKICDSIHQMLKEEIVGV
jgi:hypothetical protein